MIFLVVRFVCIFEVLGHVNISGHGARNEMIMNDIRGPCGPKVSWHSSYRWGKTPKKPHPGNLSRLGIEPGPAAWQARMLPLVPQQWTVVRFICLFAYLYIWGFMAYQHLRSLWMIMMAKWYLGTLGPKISWHLPYRWGKNPTQETCPDWGSNPGLLRDRRACYHLSLVRLKNSLSTLP